MLGMNPLGLRDGQCVDCLGTGRYVDTDADHRVHMGTCASCGGDGKAKPVLVVCWDGQKRCLKEAIEYGLMGESKWFDDESLTSFLRAAENLSENSMLTDQHVYDLLEMLYEASVADHESAPL